MIGSIKRVLEVWSDKKRITRLLSGSELIDNEIDLTKIISSGACPDCEKWEFYEGPSGGMSTNIWCGNCGSWFNYCPLFVTQRVKNTGYKSLKNYQKFDRLIAKTWIKINPRTPLLTEEICNWCAEYCEGNWSINNHYFFFNIESDVVSFKLQWV